MGRRKRTAVEDRERSDERRADEIRCGFRLRDPFRRARPNRRSAWRVGVEAYSQVFAERLFEHDFNVEQPYPWRLEVSPIHLCLPKAGLADFIRRENHSRAGGIRIADYVQSSLDDLRDPESSTVVCALHPAGDRGKLLSLASFYRGLGIDTGGCFGDRKSLDHVTYTCEGKVVFTPVSQRGNRYGMTLMAMIGAVCADEFIELISGYRGPTPVQCSLSSYSDVYTPGGMRCAEVRSEVMDVIWSTLREEQYPEWVPPGVHLSDFESEIGF